jgi:hypothetical protein
VRDGFIKNQFLVRGHSNFEVFRKPSGEIQKLAGIENKERLKAQCHKQKEFITKSQKFIVCPVLREFENQDCYGFEMPFCRGEVAPEFIDRANPQEIRSFVVSLIALVDEFIKDSPIQNIDSKVVLNKTIAVRDAIKTNTLVPQDLRLLIERHIEIIKRCEQFQIPIGKCHGDLTLSNIIFDDFNQQYYLIDFLDTYLESPVLDIAKIAQEINLLWTSRLMKQTHDRVKYQIAMRVINFEIQHYFTRYDWFAKYQSIFEFQNLIRLLPYAHDSVIIQVIMARLYDLIEV